MGEGHVHDFTSWDLARLRSAWSRDQRRIIAMSAQELRDQLLTSSEFFGFVGISAPTGERRLRDPNSGIPKPIFLGDQRFWWRPDAEAYRATIARDRAA